MAETLTELLRWLDALIERALKEAPHLLDTDGLNNRYRGLLITPEEVEQLLAQEPVKPLFALPMPLLDEFPQWMWLKNAFDLNDFDLAVMLVALAPEVDLRYERLYAYLQDDVTRKRPCVDLTLNLLCANKHEKVGWRERFLPSAPLLSHRLLHLIPDPTQPAPPLLSHALKLDEQIINYLLEQQSLDSRLGGFCEWVMPAAGWDEILLPVQVKNLLPFRPLHVYFCGLSPADHLKAAQAVAAELEMTLITVQSAYVEDVELIFREAWLKDAVLYFENFDAIASVPPLLQKFMEALAEDDGVTMMGGTVNWPMPSSMVTDVVVIPFAPPEFRQRRLCWQTQLASQGIEITTHDLNALAGRFHLTPHQIEQTVVSATGLAWLRAENIPSPDDLFAAARSQFSRALDGVAHKVTPVYTWDHLVLPEDVLEQLREMCARVAQQPRVMEEWGFGQKLSQGKGISALFTGASGTGKTMAAEVIANTLKLDLYRIDLSGVVSKYIGETEKNLSRIFDAAENTSAILFFDEADALFGKRSEVRDSHDRYANIEISYLLQKMETYEGITILATNLRQNMDEAFLRRLAFIVQFPFPDAESRRLIWQGIYAPETPLSADVNFGWLADTFKLCGGSIKNVALASAFLAASNGHEVHRAHILHALKREYTKMGEVMPELPA